MPLLTDQDADYLQQLREDGAHEPLRTVVFPDNPLSTQLGSKRLNLLQLGALVCPLGRLEPRVEVERNPRRSVFAPALMGAPKLLLGARARDGRRRAEAFRKDANEHIVRSDLLVDDRLRPLRDAWGEVFSETQFHEEPVVGQ